MKNFTTQFTLIFLILFLLTSFTIDKKGKKDLLKNSKTTVNDLTLVEKVIAFDIMNSPLVSVNTEAFLNKSALSEDSIPSFMIEFEFLDNNWTSVYYDWDSINTEWNPFMLNITYFQETLEKPDSTIYSMIDSISGEWVASRKDVIFYNAAGLDTANVGFAYNEETGNWDYETKNIYSYNGNGNVTEETLLFWDPENSEWIAWTKNMYVYEGNLLISNEYFNFDYFSFEMIPSSKTFYFYDDLNRLEKEDQYMWDYIEDGYLEYSLDKYSYLGTTENIDTVMSFDFDTETETYNASWFDKLNYSPINGMIISDDTYVLPEDKSATENTDFVKSYAFVYYYNDVGTFAKPIPSSVNLIYPNPASDRVILQIQNPENCRLEVFDIRGQLMFSKQIQSQITPVNINNLESGVYLFRISNNGKSTSKKMVKQ